MSGIRIPPLKPGSPEWHRVISASKVPAILGLSSFDSPFSTWHKMKGLIPPEPEDDVKRRGHYLEPAIVAWFNDQHPEFTDSPGGCWRHPRAAWLTASPDRMLYPLRNGDPELLECKSTVVGDEWGQPGTDEVPPGVKAQCLTQMAVVGVDRCRVAMIGPFLEFAEYVIDFDSQDWDFILGALTEFMRTLAANERPDLDSHTATYEAVRKMHPDIEPETVDLPLDVAREFCASRVNLDAAKARERGARTAVLDLMGNARKATFLGQPIATRQPNGDHTPKLVAARCLPDFTDKDPS